MPNGKVVAVEAGKPFPLDPLKVPEGFVVEVDGEPMRIPTDPNQARTQRQALTDARNRLMKEIQQEVTTHLSRQQQQPTAPAVPPPQAEDVQSLLAALAAERDRRTRSTCSNEAPNPTDNKSNNTVPKTTSSKPVEPQKPALPTRNDASQPAAAVVNQPTPAATKAKVPPSQQPVKSATMPHVSAKPAAPKAPVATKATPVVPAPTKATPVAPATKRAPPALQSKSAPPKKDETAANMRVARSGGPPIARNRVPDTVSQDEELARRLQRELEEQASEEAARKLQEEWNGAPTDVLPPPISSQARPQRLQQGPDTAFDAAMARELQMQMNRQANRDRHVDTTTTDAGNMSRGRNVPPPAMTDEELARMLAQEEYGEQ